MEHSGLAFARSSRALAMIVVAAALAATSCGEAGGRGAELPTGDWTGDVVLPGMPDAAWGATWHVARSDSTGSGLELSLSMPSARRMGPVPLEIGDDSLRFPLPFRRSADCEATRREDGSWRGSCTSNGGGGRVEVMLVPPERSLAVGAARMGLEKVDGDWRKTAAGPVVVYTRPGTEAHRHLDAVTRHARSAVEHAVELLDAGEWEGPVRLVYLESPQEMEQAVGRTVRGGWADAGANAALLVTYDGGATGVVHETLHVVSMRQWGAASRPGMWIQEGLAEWGEGADCGDVAHGRLDRFLHQRGDGLPLSTLTREFRQHSDLITMPQVTTLVGYLMDVHGLAAVQGLWQRGITEAERVLGYGSDELERRWRTWVRERYEPATEVEWSATIGSEQGCPRENPTDPVEYGP